MSPQTDRSPGRLLAPFALAAVFVALLLIVLAGAGGPGSETPESGSRAQGGSTGQAARPSRRPRGVYTVKRGDTLGSIAERNGTTVERLQELNPDLDAQSLVAGQRIKLQQ
jgi:LysM repeat protein